MCVRIKNRIEVNPRCVPPSLHHEMGYVLKQEGKERERKEEEGPTDTCCMMEEREEEEKKDDKQKRRLKKGCFFLFCIFFVNGNWKNCTVKKERHVSRKKVLDFFCMHCNYAGLILFSECNIILPKEMYHASHTKQMCCTRSHKRAFEYNICTALGFVVRTTEHFLAVFR